MLLTRSIAENALEEAHSANPGPWADHARYVALACRNIAERCPHLDKDEAYLFGLLHDIGRHAGVSSERHLIDGYRYCISRGWEKAAQICISHAFMIQDIETSIAHRLLHLRLPARCHRKQLSIGSLPEGGPPSL